MAAKPITDGPGGGEGGQGGGGEGGRSPFAELLLARGVPRIVSSGLVARLPLGMNSLAVVLFVRAEGGSYALAGLLAAAVALANGLATPVLGRLVDRLGQPAVLLPLVLTYPTALTALIVLVQQDAAAGVLVAAAVATGASVPPIAACVRTLWPRLVPRPELRTTAYALEAVLQEIFFLTGPLLVAILATLGGPAAALGFSAAAGALGTLVFATSRPAREAPRADPGGGRRASALVSPGVRTIALSALATGLSFGAIEVSMPAFGEAHGWREAGGLALGAHALGSLTGGLWTGSRPTAGSAARRYALALAGYAAGFALLQAAWSIPAVVVIAFVAGIPIAPAFAAAYALVDDTARAGTATEAFAWLSTSIVVGLAGGTALSGALIEHSGTRAAFAMGFAAAAVAAGVVVVRRHTLRPGAA